MILEAKLLRQSKLEVMKMSKKFNISKRTVTNHAVIRARERIDGFDVKRFGEIKDIIKEDIDSNIKYIYEDIREGKDSYCVIISNNVKYVVKRCEVTGRDFVLTSIKIDDREVSRLSRMFKFEIVA